MRKLGLAIAAAVFLAAAYLLADDLDLRQRGRNLWEVTAEPISRQIWRNAPRSHGIDQTEVRAIARTVADSMIVSMKTDRQREAAKREVPAPALAPAPVVAEPAPASAATNRSDLEKRAKALSSPRDRKMVLGLIASGESAAAARALAAIEANTP